jgi:hypothetical protein
MPLQQDWPYWLTQGTQGYDPNVLGAPSLDVGARVGTPQMQPPMAASTMGGPTPDALGDAVGNALPPGMNMTPPNDPVEHAARKQGWMGVIQKMFSDPVMGDTLMRVGLQMMQPSAPGQTTGGHVAKAIMGGADYKEGREAGAKKETREDLNAKSKRNLEGAQADYYRTTKGKGGAGGGGTAARVQQVKQIAAALIATHPDLYQGPKGEAQAILDAQEELTKLEREKIAAGIFRGTYLPGTDPGAAAAAAKGVAGSLAVPGKAGATVSPGRKEAPAAAIEALRANDTPENRAFFQQKYGYLP